MMLAAAGDNRNMLRMIEFRFGRESARFLDVDAAEGF